MAGGPKRQVAAPRRAVPGIDPAIARLSEMLLAALSELTIIRERLDSVERLIERHGLFDQSEVEAFKAEGDAETARNAIRRRQIRKVMRPLLDDTERAVNESSAEEPA